MNNRKLVHRLKMGLAYAFLLLVVVYTLIPFATMLLTSFRTELDVKRGPFTLPHQWNILTNYQKAWQQGRFDQYLMNSGFLTVAAVFLTLLVSTLAGYSFAKFRFPGREFLYHLLLISMMLPFQTIMLPLYFVLKSLKLLNSLPGIALVLVATNIGFSVMMMRSFFVSLPDSLLEAARLDGCNELQIILRIVMPNTFPAWSSLVVFVAMWAWNNLLAPMLFLFSESKYPVPYALYAFIGTHMTRYELLSAAMVISIVPLLVIYFVFQRQFTSNLLGGALKG